jgi:hypothetical protein
MDIEEKDKILSRSALLKILNKFPEPFTEEENKLLTDLAGEGFLASVERLARSNIEFKEKMQKKKENFDISMEEMHREMDSLKAKGGYL